MLEQTDIYDHVNSVTIHVPVYNFMVGGKLRLVHKLLACFESDVNQSTGMNTQ